MGELNNSELLWLWKIVPINLFLIWLIVYPRMITAQLHWICTLQSVRGSEEQTLCFTHSREAFQLTFKEQAPSHQSVFLVVHLLGRKRHMGLLWGKAVSSWWTQVLEAWEHQFFRTWDETQFSSKEEQKSYAPLQPYLNSSAGTGRGKRRKPYVSCLWKYQIKLISNLCSMRSVLLV